MRDAPKTAAEFDARFDAGEDMGRFFNAPSVTAADLPIELASRIDAVASKRGITRAELINRWLTEKLDEAA